MKELKKAEGLQKENPISRGGDGKEKGKGGGKELRGEESERKGGDSGRGGKGAIGCSLFILCVQNNLGLLNAQLPMIHIHSVHCEHCVMV